LARVITSGSESSADGVGRDATKGCIIGVASGFGDDGDLNLQKGVRAWSARLKI